MNRDTQLTRFFLFLGHLFSTPDNSNLFQRVPQESRQNCVSRNFVVVISKKIWVKDVKFPKTRAFISDEACLSEQVKPIQVLKLLVLQIGHLFVYSVTRPMNGSEAACDLVLIQTSLFL